MLLPCDPVMVERIKRLHNQGSRSSAILHALASDGLTPVQMMSHFHEAFELSFDDVHCIGGWAADGTGELDDAAVDAFLEPAIGRARAIQRPTRRRVG